MKNRFFMLAGLPASGKSCLARQYMEKKNNEYREAGLDKQVVWISSDSIREELYGSEEEQGDANKVFGVMKKRTDAALSAGHDVIYDACNVSEKRRRTFLNGLKRFSCQKICLIIATPFAVCMEPGKDRSLRKSCTVCTGAGIRLLTLRAGTGSGSFTRMAQRGLPGHRRLSLTD